jgi:tetratricopeptide (TPR) repeat protein
MPEPTTQVTFAAELRRLRGEVSLRALARRACCSKSVIGDIETGRRLPTPRIAGALDKAVGADGKLVELAEAERQQAERATTTAPDQAVDGLLLDWDSVFRRDFLKGTGVAAAALTGLGAEQTLDADSHDLLIAHKDLRAAHGRLDNLRGAQAVYSQAREHHQQILAWLTTATSDTERQRIAAFAADTGGFVGFLTYDLGQAELAIAHYRDAAGHAQTAGDISSCCNLLGQSSRILADLGHYDKALDLAHRALHLAGTRAHPAVRSWLHAVRAHHHACLTRSRAAHTDLATAWKLLDRADDGEKPPYIGYLNAAELNKWTGHTAVRLSSSKASAIRTGRTALDEARATWPTSIVRGSAEVLTASAHIYVADGEREVAADFVSRAIAVATTTGSARNLRAALTAQTLVMSASSLNRRSMS